jgi:hypothetical protein
MRRSDVIITVAAQLELWAFLGCSLSNYCCSLLLYIIRSSGEMIKEGRYVGLIEK